MRDNQFRDSLDMIIYREEQEEGIERRWKRKDKFGLGEKESK